jgi:hypothetical protein
MLSRRMDGEQGYHRSHHHRTFLVIGAPWQVPNE